MKKLVLVLSLMMACFVNANAKGTYRGFFDAGPTIGDGPGISTTTTHGKTYQSADTYDNDNTQDLALNLSPLELDLAESTGVASTTAIATTPAVKIDNSIDLNIPSFSAKNTRTFAVIIGNENYQRAEKVRFANNDALYSVNTVIRHSESHSKILSIIKMQHSAICTMQ